MFSGDVKGFNGNPFFSPLQLTGSQRFFLYTTTLLQKTKQKDA
jgi:hypothetical protein